MSESNSTGPSKSDTQASSFSAARSRWLFIRRAVTTKTIPALWDNPVSKRTFEVFTDLIEFKADETCHHVVVKLPRLIGSSPGQFSDKSLVKVAGADSTKSRIQAYHLLISEKFNDLSLDVLDISGSDKSGRICIWPSEQILAYWTLRNPFLFKGQRILELGGGFHCLAGLALAKFTKAEKVILTDGDEVNVARASDSILLNKIPTDACHARVLTWGQSNSLVDMQNYFDTVIAADVIYEKSIFQPLLETVAYVLKPRGEFILFNPKRNGILNEFLQLARKQDVLSDVNVQNHYDPTVDEILVKLSTEKNAFTRDWHYPVKVTMRKASTKVSFGFSS